MRSAGVAKQTGAPEVYTSVGTAAIHAKHAFKIDLKTDE
jgi:hypothetical protein